MKSAAAAASPDTMTLGAFRTDYRSPNFNARKLPCDLIVLHYTDMPDAESALRRLCDPKAEVSAHFLIDESGTVFALVDTDKRAWHAGVSSWQGQSDINSRSVGIELANPGHSTGYAPFPDAQIEALCGVLGHLTGTLKIDPRNLVGHSDIAPLRKQDPGELFPWAEVAKRGFGIWPELPAMLPAQIPPVATIQAELRAIGYDCPQSGAPDAATRACILAFQRHFQPDHLTGVADARTAALLAALSRGAPQRDAGTKRFP